MQANQQPGSAGVSGTGDQAAAGSGATLRPAASGIRARLAGASPAAPAGAAPSTARPRARAGWRYATAAVSVALLSLVVLAWWIAETVGRRWEQEALQAGYDRAMAGAAAAEQFTLRTLGLVHDMQRLARRWAELDAAGETAAAAELSAVLREMTRDPENLVEAVVVHGPDGAVRWSSIAALGADQVADRDFFRVHTTPEAAPGLHIGAPLTSRVTGRAILPASIGLRDDAGAFAGTVSAMLWPEALGQGLATLASRPGDVVSIVLRNGMLVARSSEADRLVGAAVTPQRWASRLRVEPMGTARARGPVTGRDQLYAWRTIDRPGLHAVMAVGAEEAGIEAARYRAILRSGAAATTAFALASILACAVYLRLREAAVAAEIEQSGFQRLKEIHAGLPVSVFVREVAADGSTRLLHRGGDSMLVTGWSEAELAGQDIMVHAAPGTAWQQSLRDTVQTGRGRLDYQLRQPDGSWRAMRSFARVLETRPDGSGVVAGVTLDISAEAEAEARALASAQLAALGEMALGLAHELKQPLQVITLTVDRAQMAPRDLSRAEIDAVLEGIVQQSMRAARVIENVRRFARGLEDGSGIEPVALDDVIGTVRELVEGAMVEATVALAFETGHPAPVVLGQRVALEQVLVNLLLNARDAIATRPQGAPRRIHVAAHRVEDRAEIEIADTGGGIPPVVMERLFQPFVTTKGPDRGTGLGLSICHGLVQGMGGRLAARNGEEGAILTITLPAAPAPAR